MLHFLPGALSFLLTLVLVIDWALHRRSLVWYAGPLIVGGIALFQLGERYLLDLFIGGGFGGIFGWILFKFPIDWMTLRWQRRVWIRRIVPGSRDTPDLIGARGVRLTALAVKGLPVAPTWVITPASLLEHISHSSIEEDFATLVGQNADPDENTLKKLAQRARDIITEEPLPWALRQTLARAWAEVTAGMGAHPRALLTAWPAAEQRAIDRALLWPRRWRVAENFHDLCENLLELWADNHTLHALRHRREGRANLVDQRLAVALQSLPPVTWTGLAASVDSRGGTGWLVECWRGDSLLQGDPPGHRRMGQGGKSGTPQDAGPTALIVAQASRAAQIAAHAMGSPGVITWRATKGEEVIVVDVVPLGARWTEDATPPRFSPEGWEWGVRVPDFKGQAIPPPSSGPSEANCADRVLRTPSFPNAWHPAFAALSGWVVEEASVLSEFASACRDAGQGVVISHGAPPQGPGAWWGFLDRRGAPEQVRK